MIINISPFKILLKNASNKLMMLLFILMCSSIYPMHMSAFEIDSRAILGQEVIISNTDTLKYYAVFLPFDEVFLGQMCASMTGLELLEQPDLRFYGTCFNNDTGVFKIVELKQFLHADYVDTKNNGEIISEQSISIISEDSVNIPISPVNNIDVDLPLDNYTATVTESDVHITDVSAIDYASSSIDIEVISDNHLEYITISTSTVIDVNVATSTSVDINTLTAPLDDVIVATTTTVEF